MTKAELAERIAETTDISKAKAEQVINSATDTISDMLSVGESVTIKGFGTFEAKARKERQGRNPRTGKEITIAAKTVVNFKPGKKLKEAVNV